MFFCLKQNISARKQIFLVLIELMQYYYMWCILLIILDLQLVPLHKSRLTKTKVLTYI